MRKMRKIRNNWINAHTYERRMEVIGKWMSHAMNEIADLDNNSPIEVLIKVNNQAQTFTDKPITFNEDPFFDCWLADNWFQSIIAQVLKDRDDAPTALIFDKLFWDYEDALHPKVSSMSTTEIFKVHDVIAGFTDGVTLRLVSKDAVPVGSVWVSKKAAEYEILSNDRGRCEMEGDFGTIFRTEQQIFKNFTRKI